MNIAELRRLEAEAENVKRYAPSVERTLSGMTERPEGDYIRYADYLAMRNALPELLKALEWQPIETAQNGEHLLYFPATKTRLGTGLPSMVKVDFHPVSYPRKPTHWMPLPLPPHGGVDVG